jgi:hypothetical protein
MGVTNDIRTKTRHGCLNSGRTVRVLPGIFFYISSEFWNNELKTLQFIWRFFTGISFVSGMSNP